MVFSSSNPTIRVGSVWLCAQISGVKLLSENHGMKPPSWLRISAVKRVTMGCLPERSEPGASDRAATAGNVFAGADSAFLAARSEEVAGAGADDASGALPTTAKSPCRPDGFAAAISISAAGAAFGRRLSRDWFSGMGSAAVFAFSSCRS
ncbi:hypothetical protein SDC9_90189 [bioreactor metagenome]|uniref:Uncharacterized protein n=1 Tax=bioreactor metagenome TaxID=1076179 RepID=A0A644ZRN2_9ZZZZ